MRGRNEKQPPEVTVPHQLRCPISLEMMKDPVILCTGITYDRHSIERWLDAGNDACPVTNQRLQSREVLPNHTLRRLIQHWCVLNAVDRIPTPTPPLSPAGVSRILGEIARGQPEAAERLRSLAGRDRKRVASAPEAPRVLAAGLAARGRDSPRFAENAVAVLAAILGTGGSVRPPPDGLAEALVQLTAQPRCAEACVTCICHVAGDGDAREKLVGAGAVAALLEILPEADGGACERALGALDALCGSPAGRSAARRHALTVPVVVKKMLRVSDAATELAVSILWTVCHHDDDDDGGGGPDGSAAVSEALQAGAFLKLLVLVQVRCEGKTRERASALLKLFNKCASGQWDRCTDDTLDLKQVRRSF